MKSLYLLLYKRYCFFYIFKDINIIFFRFYYQYLFSYDKLVLNFFFFFFKYNFKFWFIFDFFYFYLWLYVEKNIYLYMYLIFQLIRKFFTVDLIFFYFVVSVKLNFKIKAWVFRHFLNRFDFVVNGVNKNLTAFLDGLFFVNQIIKIKRVYNVFKMRHAGAKMQKMRRQRYNTARLKYLSKRLHLF